MHEALEDIPPSNFPVPKTGLKRIKICVESNLLATPYCPEVKTATFIKGSTPTKYCDIHTEPKVTEEEGEKEEKDEKKKDNKVNIPDVVGMPSSEAISALQQAGFGVARSMQASTLPAGQVIAQSPSGGSSAPAGTTVLIIVSSGPPEPTPQPEQ